MQPRLHGQHGGGAARPLRAPQRGAPRLGQCAGVWHSPTGARSSAATAPSLRVCGSAAPRCRRARCSAAHGGSGESGRLLRPLLIDNYDSYTYNLYQIIAEVYGGEGVWRCVRCVDTRLSTGGGDVLRALPGACGDASDGCMRAPVPW
jgi:hypothetical protein